MNNKGYTLCTKQIQHQITEDRCAESRALSIRLFRGGEYETVRRTIEWPKRKLAEHVVFRGTVLGVACSKRSSSSWSSIMVERFDVSDRCNWEKTRWPRRCTVIWTTRRLGDRRLGDKSKLLNLGQPHRPGSCTRSLAVIICFSTHFSKVHRRFNNTDRQRLKRLWRRLHAAHKQRKSRAKCGSVVPWILALC